MNVYTCTDHEGHQPVGVSSVVVAATEKQARALLIAELEAHGLKTKIPFTLRRINTDEARAFVLGDGDY